MSITYTFLGHGSHQVEVDGTTILIDPWFEDNPQAAVSAAEVNPDFILISHGHNDHIGDAVPIAQRSGAKVISNFEIVDWLGRQGLENLHPQHLGGGFQHEFGYLKLTLAHHGSGLPDGSNGGNPAGFLLKTGGKTLYFACDTALFLDMKLLGEEGLDLAVLPIGDNFTMGPEDALRAVQLLTPKIAVPCHYNTFPLIQQDAEAWKTKVEAETETQVKILPPGEAIKV